MTKLGDEIFVGASGKKYNFIVYSTDTKFNDVGAVYIFKKRYRKSDGSYKYTPLYIGQTNSLKDRIPSHEEWPCVRRHGVNSICIHLDESKSSRLVKEKDLIDRGSSPPPCND